MHHFNFIGTVSFKSEYTSRQLEFAFGSSIGGNKGDISDFAIDSDGNISGTFSTTLGLDSDDCFDVVPEVLSEFDSNCTKMLSSIEIEAVSH